MGSCKAAAAAFVALVSTRAAHAHLAPAVLGVIAEENGAPVAVRLAHGLATLDEESRWRFVCPRTWEGPDAPLALGISERRIVVVGATNTWELASSGIAERRLAPGVDTLTAKKLVNAGGSVFVLASLQGAAIVVRFDPGGSQPVLESSTSIDSIAAAEDRLILVGPAATGATLTEVTLEGGAIHSAVTRAPEAIGATISLERAGGELYGVFAKSNSWTLARFDGAAATVIATSTTPIVGPVESGGEKFVVINSKLARVTSSTVTITDESRTYTCATGAYACARTQLYAIEADGSAERLVFDMTSVKGPRLAHFDEDARVACTIEWSDFAREAGLDPAIPDHPMDPKPEPKSGCSCSSTQPGARWPAVLLFALIFDVRRRPDRR
jgi:MYXO-CTERM domain-containing protein